ncbi:MAG: hypothetical protein ABI557_10115 [Aureliella sp.]
MLKKMCDARKARCATLAARKAAQEAAEHAAKGLRDQLAKRRQKLIDYMKDPDKYDNKGILKGASPEMRRRIIEGRMRNLEGQIDNFQKQIQAILDSCF